jgi:hypothetical protein
MGLLVPNTWGLIMPDWSKIILELSSIFGSCRQVARLIHYGNPDYLRKMTRDEIKDPPWSVGDRLIELYRKHVGDDVPIIGAPQQKKLI